MYALMEYFHELKKEKLRMLLTVLGVCWGMANIVLMLAVGEGLYRSLLRGSRSMGEGIVIVWNGQTSKAFAGFPVGRPIRLIEDDVTLIKKRVQSIGRISPEYMDWSAELRDEKNTVTTQLSGVYPEYGPMRNMIPEAGGRFINDLDQAYKRRVVFIGNVVRDKFFGEGNNPVGRQIMINNVPFTVIGVMQKKMQTNSYSGMDQDRCAISASTYRAMYHDIYMSNVVFQPRYPLRSKETIAEFRRAVATKYRCHTEDDDIIHTWDTIEGDQIQIKILRGIQIFLGIIGGLTLVIAGIGVANIMYVTVKERTREIGIKMAVGARPGLIIGQFVVEALLTVGIGGALGILLGQGMIDLIRALPIQNQAMEYVGRPVFSATLALICSTILTFIGLLTGVFPARRASTVDPVEALRYE
ncbi:MAG TPA: ABC transporter permease [Candidatus Glassbacteria bacterium]|nr:ABC transporter permease [Candidatus Glassbacteria bacterium]